MIPVVGTQRIGGEELGKVSSSEIQCPPET